MVLKLAARRPGDTGTNTWGDCGVTIPPPIDREALAPHLYDWNVPRLCRQDAGKAGHRSRFGYQGVPVLEKGYVQKTSCFRGRHVRCCCRTVSVLGKKLGKIDL